MLVQAVWRVCDVDQANITAYRGVAIREFPSPCQMCSKKQLYTHPKNTSFMSVALYALQHCAVSRDREAHHDDFKINVWCFTRLNLRTCNESPNRDTAQAVAFAWIDNKEVRPPDSKAFALLNDSEIAISSAVTDELQNYDVRPIPWSKREEVWEELAA